MPLSKRSFIAAASLGFAHTVGEFGVVLMIGGNIPGQTQVLSIALFDKVEAMAYTEAHWFAGGLIVFSLVLLGFIYNLNRRSALGPTRLIKL
jgi:molybdate transport system permease protein